MRYLSIAILGSLLLAGCSFHNKQNDLADNQYHKVEKHAAPSATYVGDWSVDEEKWLKKLIINKNGSTKVVLYPGLGAVDGKIFLHEGKPHLILPDGTKVEIVSVDEESLLIEAYGKQERLKSM